MTPLPQLAYLILPMVLAGIGNMIWMKLPVLKRWQIPMDGGRLWLDKRRWFGDNKTWKGFVGMMMTSAICLGCFAGFDRQSTWAQSMSVLPFERTPIGIWFLWGAWWGLCYVVAELPNSFIKRRFSIVPGGEAQGAKGWFFKVLDQSDSVIGCLLGMPLFYRVSLPDALVILVMATAFHFLTNALLFMLGLKKQAA